MRNSPKRYYPIPVSGIAGFLFSVAFGVFIGLFLWYFEPFDLNTLDYTDFEILFFGIISFAVFFTAHTVLPLLIPNIYNEKKWTVSSQIFFYLILAFFIATLNGLYINYLNNLSFNWGNYWFIITRTIAIGSIPICIYVLLSFYWKYKQLSERAELLNEGMPEKQILETALQQRIKTNIKSESFLIEDNSFLFAKANGNYIEVYRKGQQAELYRMNLAELESQLKMYPHFIRCHRSYLVNAKQISKVTGNAQGLKLWLEHDQQFIPTSRKYIAEIKSYLNPS